MRLDRFLRNQLAIPQSLVEKYIRRKEVTVTNTNNLPEKWEKVTSSLRIQAGQYVHLNTNTNVVPTEEEPTSNRKKAVLPPEVIKKVQSWVIHQDQDIIIINKPAGLAVQGETESLSSMLSALCFEYDEPPYIVHRLDKHTSGILLLARNRPTASKLSEDFRSQRVHKLYYAITIGQVEKKEGIIRSPLSKKGDKQDEEGKVVIDRENGLSASSGFYVMDQTGNKDTGIFSFLALKPHTGRTHQLRVHCASELKTPILGDTKYGPGFTPSLDLLFEDSSNIEGLQLHAREMTFKHPTTKAYTKVKAVYPSHMMAAIKTLGFQKNPVDPKAHLPDSDPQFESAVPVPETKDPSGWKKPRKAKKTPEASTTKKASSNRPKVTTKASPSKVTSKVRKSK